jgi:ADP-heptose:LPS heptosyltransferase
MNNIRKSIIKKSALPARPQKVNRVLGLKEFSEQRNKVLIVRSVGGLGDIFMHRMIFEDFKKLMPDAEIHFCCPKYYHDAISDHPFVDKILDTSEIDKEKYIVSYNTSTVCGRTEMRYAPLAGPHRSDIWANHCGVNLTKHDMHIRLTDEEKEEGKKIIENYRDRDGYSVAICPVSAMITKNLQDHQILDLVNEIRNSGLYPFCLHNKDLNVCLKNKIPMIGEKRIRIWMSVLNQADYVISVDTAAFHCAGGMKKPLVGIFTFVDGKVYGKYFDFVLVQKHREDDPQWVCGPCYDWHKCPKTNSVPKPCLTEITVENIMTAVNSMLAKWPK